MRVKKVLSILLTAGIIISGLPAMNVHHAKAADTESVYHAVWKENEDGRTNSRGDIYGFYATSDNSKKWVSNNTNVSARKATDEFTIWMPFSENVSIPWSVSSEENFDTFTVWLDGDIVVDKESGVKNGTIDKLLTAGSHTIKVRYKKDAMGDANDDNATITLNDVTSTFADHTHTFKSTGSCHMCTICNGIWEHKFQLDHTDAATCTEAEVLHYKCACGDEYTEDGEPALGHDYTETITKEPTCTEAGHAKEECSRCGLITEEDIEPNGHTWKRTSYSVDPEDKTKGTINYKCEICGHTKSEEYTKDSIFTYTLTGSGSSYVVGLNDDASMREVFTAVGLYDNIVIPDEYNNLPIVKIDTGFFDVKTIQPKKIIFGNNIKTISEGWCKSDNLANVQELVLDDKLENIPTNAFSGLGSNISDKENWPDVTIPASVVETGDHAFSESRIKNLKFAKNESNKQRDCETSQYEFYNALINNLDLSNVKKVNNYCFINAAIFNGVDIKSSVEFVGNNCFYNAIVPSFHIEEAGKPVYFMQYSLNMIDTKKSISNSTYQNYNVQSLGTCWDQDEIVFPERSVLEKNVASASDIDVNATIKLLGHVGDGYGYDTIEECAQHVTDELSTQFWIGSTQNVIIGNNIKSYAKEMIAYLNPQQSITFGSKINIATEGSGNIYTRKGKPISNDCTITYTTNKPFFIEYYSLSYGKVRFPNTKVKLIENYGFTSQARFDEPVDLSECEYFGEMSCIYNTGGTKYAADVLDLSSAVQISNSAFNYTGLHAEKVVLGENLRYLHLGAFSTWQIDEMTIPEKTMQIVNSVSNLTISNLTFHSSPVIKYQEYDITDCYSKEVQDAWSYIETSYSRLKKITPNVKDTSSTGTYIFSSINNIVSIDVSGILYPFINSSSLETAKFNDMLTDTIPSGMMNNKQKLKTVVLDQNTRVLPENCFTNCPRLQNINLEDTKIEKIGDNAFAGAFCTGDEPVTIQFPDTLKYIGSIFNSSSNIKELHTNKIESIKGGYLNQELPSLSKLYLDDALKTLDGWTSSGTPLQLDYLYVGNNVNIKTNNFMPMHNVKEVKFGDEVKEIQRMFAQGDGALQKVSLPASLESIGANAFTGCGNLKSIDLPDTLLNIGNQAFISTGITAIDLPASLEYIGDNAFSGTHIKELEFKDADDNDGRYHNIELGNGCFASMSDLQKIYLSNTIYTVPDSTFAGCTNVKTIYMGNKLIDIQDTFSGMTNLEKVYCYHWSNYNKKRFMEEKANGTRFAGSPSSTQFIELYDIDYHHDNKITKYRAEYEVDETLYAPEEKHGVFHVIGWGLSENGLMKYTTTSKVRNITEDYQNGIALYARYGAYIPFEITGDNYTSAKVTMSTKEKGGKILIRDYDITNKKEIPIFETVNRVLYATFTVDGISTTQKLE